MNKYIIIIGVALLVLSCGNRTKQETSIYHEKNRSEAYEVEKVDTVTKIELQEAKEERTKGKKSAVSSGSYSSSSSSDVDDDYDNMRGFDPASEDDMDDNGMSRYMENTDEEGWD